MSLNTILATTPLTSTGYHLKATGTTIGNSLIWDNGTNVGIGNTNTSYTLDVSGTGRFTSTLLVSGILTTGTNVGVGVTPSNGWVNGYALEVGFVGSALWGRYSNEFHLTNNYYYSASTTSRLYASTAPASDYEQYNGIHTWSTAPSGTINTAVTLTPRMTITNAGNVGIGTSSPIAPLSIPSSVTNSQITTGSLEIQSFGTNNSWIADNLYYNNGFKARVTGYTSQIYFDTGGNIGFFTNNGVTTAGATSSLGQRMLISASGAVTIAGSLSKGSGSFRIDHPLESMTETHQLVHSFIEGPQADLIYRGKLTLVNGKAQANIDLVSTMTEGTFEALCREIQCFTTNESGWDLVKGKVIGNIIYIESQNQNSTDEISWMVIGERKDKHMMDTEWTDDNGRVIVEPLKPIEPSEPIIN